MAAQGKTNNYWTLAHEVDGHKEGYSSGNTFKELIDKASRARQLINQHLRDENSEISW